MPIRSSGSASVRFPRYSRRELIARLKRRLPALRPHLPVRRVVLFGSQATGRATGSSDIDLLVVYAGAPQPHAYRTVHKTLDTQGLEPHLYTEREAEALSATVRRMTAQGIVLFEAGTELEM